MNNGGEYRKVDFLSLSLKAPVDFHCRKHKFMGANRFKKKKQITLSWLLEFAENLFRSLIFLNHHISHSVKIGAFHIE